ncbi:MAG: flagellin lysine-N-methylase [Ruminiclostridium sp.]|nr:flagellin lysine-N-methylase [Ruminiclostridium sp.]
MLLVYPDYYPDFKCIASECKHSCCIGWEIDIDPESSTKFQAIEGPMGERLAESISLEEEPHFILGEEERCPFLNQEGLCDLILFGGEDILCQICTDHPRYRNFLPGRTEIGVGLCCEAAGQLILSRKEPVTLCVTGAKEETAAETLPILDLRQEAFEIAQDRTKTLTEREETLLEHFLGWVPELSISQWAEVYLELERLDDVWTDVLENLRTHGNAVDLDGFSRHMKDREEEYEQLMVYFLYRHFLTAYEDGDVSSKVSFAVLSTRMIRLLGALHWQQTGSFTLEDQVEYARMYSAEIEYSQDNLDALFTMLM